MTPLLVAAGVAVFAGAALQAATGFGFARARGAAGVRRARAARGDRPAAAARHGDRRADARHRGPPAAPAGRGAARSCSRGRCPPRSRASPCCARSTRSTLQVAVSVGVAATLSCAGARRAEQRGPEPRWAAPATGLSAGALVTSTNTSGPPLLLYLLGRGDEPGRVRDTLTVCQLGLSVIGALAIVVTGTAGAVPERRADRRVRPARAARAPRRAAAVRAASRARGGYEPVLNATLVVAVAAGLVTAVL